MKPCRINRKPIALMVMEDIDGPEALRLAQHLQLCEGCRQYHDEIVFVKRRVSSMDALAQAPASELATFTAPPAGLRRLPFSRPTALRQSLAYLGLALWRGSQTWRIASSAIAILAVASLTYSFLLPRSPQRALLSQAAPVSASTVPIELAPTFANYHAIADHSLDELDALLERQALQPIPGPVAFSGRSLALLNPPE